MNDQFELITPAIPLKEHYQIGLVITTYNRPAYLKRCLHSLSGSNLEETLLLLVDDGSDDPRTLEMIRDFNPSGVALLKAFRRQKEGCAMYENLRYGWDLLREQYGCTYLSNLDPDALVRPHWLPRIKELYEQERPHHGGLLVTGFNAYQHPVLDQIKNGYQKQSLGGLNLFFDGTLYDEAVSPALVDIDWDWRIVHALQERNYPILCTRPSVIQHIGREGFWSGKSSVFDFAVDYGSANRLYMALSTLYFRGRRRGAWLLRHWGQRLHLTGQRA